MKPLPGFGKASIFLTDMSVQENSSKHARQDGIEEPHGKNTRVLIVHIS